MKLTLFADQCTTCSGQTKAYVSLLQNYCWANGVELLMKSTRNSRENQIEAEQAIQNLEPIPGWDNLKYSVYASYPPFISNGNKAIELAGITNEKIKELL